MKEYNICLCADNNVIEYMLALIVSILKNSSEDEEFYFHIITSSMSEENKNHIDNLKQIKNFKLQYYSPINKEKFIKWHREKTSGQWGVEAFSKLDIPFLLNHLDKVLYLDCDMIVLNNLKELFELDINDNLAAVVKDKDIKYFKVLEMKFNFFYNYFNSGLMLINIKMFNELFKENDFFDIIEKYLNTIKCLKYIDQDIFNYIFQNKVQYLDSKYNFTCALLRKDKEVQKAVIAHYTLLKPLYRNAYPQKNKLYYAFWKYFIETSIFKNNISKYIDIIIEQGNNDIIKHNKLVDSISWWIPFRNMRNNFKTKYKIDIKEKFE